MKENKAHTLFLVESETMMGKDFVWKPKEAFIIHQPFVYARALFVEHEENFGSVEGDSEGYQGDDSTEEGELPGVLAHYFLGEPIDFDLPIYVELFDTPFHEEAQLLQDVVVGRDKAKKVIKVNQILVENFPQAFIQQMLNSDDIAE